MIKFEKEVTGLVPDHGFTHGAKFHADDLFSTALLRLINPDIQVERGFDVPENFDGIVYDIGRGRFDHHQQDNRCGVCRSHILSLTEQLVHMHSKGTTGAERPCTYCGSSAGGVHQCGSFAHDTSHCQNDSGEDSRHCAGQNDAEDRPQTSCAKSEAALPERVRHAEQCLFRGTHNQRQHHQQQRARTGKKGIPPAQPQDEQQKTKKPKQNGRYSR